MFHTINNWLHQAAHAIVHLFHRNHDAHLALEGFGNMPAVALTPMNNDPVDLGGWNVILVSDFEQAQSAVECLSPKCAREREILPLGQRGYLIRWR